MFKAKIKNKKIYIELERDYLKLRLEMISGLCSDPDTQNALEEIIAQIESLKSAIERIDRDYVKTKNQPET